MKKKIKILIDIFMSIILIFLMAYQVTGEKLHEFIGTAMLILFIIHNVLNIKWYSHIFKGKYSAIRLLHTIVNIVTLIAIVLIGISGMAMSQHIFTFFPIRISTMIARQLHLSCSYISFVMMSIHLGLHWSMIAGKIKTDNKVTIFVMRIIVLIITVYGAYLFGRADIYMYIFMKTPFATLDYDKSSIIILVENIIMMTCWVCVGYYISKFFVKRENWKYMLVAIGLIIVSILSIHKENAIVNANNWQNSSDDNYVLSDNEVKKEQQIGENMIDNTDINDGFVFINGGTYIMGSPETENWRIIDEVQHEVTVSSFYISPYELTQKEYIELCGTNPSIFIGDNLPVENISWLDAVIYCNKRSEADGLTPVYTINDNNVSWDRSANGYRLPTEAEWEYACRAGTNTPFNTQTSISSDEANYYGYYPYDIEENYFAQENLTTKPGQYRQTTVAVDSFNPNEWGLYNMHGNVGEWVWDYYGEYNTNENIDPTGANNGTLRVYRGGGWNDFAKNIRSAYRATLEQDKTSFNIGVRLVRNATSIQKVVGNATNVSNNTSNTHNNILIVYYSWSGNTRAIAQEIQSQIDADVFEITLKKPYSTDYSTVLDQSQQDQSIQARPAINGTIDNISDYDTILLGYPNWWASIPMPIATFLESYDLSDKTIIPFCSHGGGRFGQSLTAISKLEPLAKMGEPLSIHYRGGDNLKNEITEWLKENQIKLKQ